MFIGKNSQKLIYNRIDIANFSNLRIFVKKNIIEKKRLKDEIKKIKSLYKICPWLNNSKKKTSLNTKIFFQGMCFISKSLECEVYGRIEKLRFLFWENKSIFSIFNLKKRLGKAEFSFFEIYNFLMNLFTWKSGISFDWNPGLFLYSLDQTFLLVFFMMFDEL